jgi:glycosyltransferase involved in cell wall biosynthesis
MSQQRSPRSASRWRTVFFGSSAFSVPVLEALLHEVPVVATEISGLPEVIRPGTTGWLTRAADPERLARAVQEAAADPREARRRVLAGRDLVAREFDSKRNYTRLKALFDELAGEKTGKP